MLIFSKSYLAHICVSLKRLLIEYEVLKLGLVLKLKDLLCNTKSKLLSNSFPGVYRLECSCGSVYIGETKKRVLTSAIELQQDSMIDKWEFLRATEHTKSCHGWFNCAHSGTRGYLCASTLTLGRL